MKKNNRKYFTVCNATAKNENTGNVCVNINEVTRQTKDFLYMDGDNEIVLDKRWVLNHVKPMYGWRENNDGTKTRFMFYVLQIKDILTYEAA
jgi:hypothetical protein